MYTVIYECLHVELDLHAVPSMHGQLGTWLACYARTPSIVVSLPYMVGLARCVLHVWLARHVCAPPYKDGLTHLLLSMYVDHGHALQCKVGSAWPSMHGHLGTSCPADMASLAHPCPSMHGWLGTAQSVLIFELGGWDLLGFY